MDLTRIDLESIEILDFERRIKMFAHPVNRGRVTVDQLCRAFADLGTFQQLHNPFSLMHKLLLSPFFRELPLSHYKKMDQAVARDTYVLSDAGYLTRNSVSQMRASTQKSIEGAVISQRVQIFERLAVGQDTDQFSF